MKISLSDSPAAEQSLRPIVGGRMRDDDLAWTLADLTRGYLNKAERLETYVALGSGEIFSAVQRMTSVAVREQIALPSDLIVALHTWWSAHDSSDHEFGALISSLSTGSTNQGARVPVSDSTSCAESTYLTVSRPYRRPTRTPLKEDDRVSPAGVMTIDQQASIQRVSPAGL